MIVLCGNLTIPYCGRFFHCFYLEERKNCATALAGHRAAILFNHMLNVLQAEYRTLDFHIHENSDELFYCIEGEFDIEFEDGLTHLCEGDFIIIPKGTKHRPICNELVKCLLIEVEGTLNQENTGGTYTG